MNYKVGERVSWRSINRDFTGVVKGFYKSFAVVAIDGSGKRTLLDNRNQKKTK